MVSANIRRVVALFIFLALIEVNNGQVQGVPEVKIQAFKPKGFRAYLDDVPHLALFIFHGNVNKPIHSKDTGVLTGEVYKEVTNKWVFEDCDYKLKVGDVINYNVFVSFEINGYSNQNQNFFKENLSFIVRELEEPNSIVPASTNSNLKCQAALTKVYGGQAVCAGKVIFEENFDTLRENFWKVEQYIPIHHNEAPFVSYQQPSSNPIVSVVNGNLRITSILQQNVPGYSDDSITTESINLQNGCTSDAEACYKQAMGPDILPPIISGRVTSRNFAFKYGTVHVRAKLPLGNWLYPEILLEPIQKYKYGRSNFASGVIKIACARGNNDLNASSLLYGNSVLYGGPIMDFTCSRHLLNYKLLPDRERWGDEFHEYSMRWDPESITLSVDGEEWARVSPKGKNGLLGWFTQECKHVRRELLGYQHGPKMAPFDDYFYLTLGVAAGGITEFPDGSQTNGGRTKPWTNSGRKAMLNFWQDMPNWITTWNQPELLVDYIKVVAI